MAKAKPAKEFQYPDGRSEARRALADEILWALHLDGPFEDREHGRASTQLAQYLDGDVTPNFSKNVSMTVRELAEAGYIDRDCQATRTYSIALAKGISPDDSPFPPNPFPTAGADVGEVPVVTLVPVADETPDAATEGRHDAVAIALEITGLAAQLVRELPAQIAPVSNGQPDWVKLVLEDNIRLTAEN